MTNTKLDKLSFAALFIEMAGEIVLKGYLVWLAPLLLILLTFFVTLLFSRSVLEQFESEDLTEKKKEDHQDDKKEEIKEGFDTFAQTAEILEKDWRLKDIPQTLKAYYGPIQGYNCGKYSEYAFDQLENKCLSPKKCPQKYYYPSNRQEDYIFPNKMVYKGETPLSPYFLDEQEDVINTLIDQKDRFFAEKLSPKQADLIARPSYMYHRGDGTLDPIIHDGNRFAK